MMSEDGPRIRRIEELGNQAAARGRDVLPAGPLRARLDPSTGLVWFSARDEAARAVYAGIGIRLAGTRLNFIGESGGAA
jgi:hypothetical protein